MLPFIFKWMSFLSVQLLEPKNGLKVLKNALGLFFKSFDFFIPVLLDSYSSLFGGLVSSFASKFPVFWRFASQVRVICFAFSSNRTFPMICHVRHVFLAHTNFLRVLLFWHASQE